MDRFVGLRDYPEGSPIFDMMGGDQLAALNKAMETGHDIVQVGETGARTFRVQSLESTMKLAVEKNEKLFPIWSKIAKDPAFSTTIEYTRQNDWGEESDLFVAEQAALKEVDGGYERLAKLVKYMAIKKQVTHVATLVRSIVDPMAQAAHEGTMQILRGAEFAFMYGCEDINPLSFDSFPKQIAAAASGTNADIVYDLEGNPPSEAMLEKAGRIVADHFGDLNYLLMGTKAKSDLTKSMFGYQRIGMPPPTGGRWGAVLDQYDGTFGEISIRPSRYIRTFAPRTVSMTGAPTTLSGGTLPVASTTANANTKLDAGTTYYYWVSVAQEGVESAAAACSQTAEAGKDNTITVANTSFAGGSTEKTYYITVYRSTVNDITTATRIARVPKGKTMNADGSLSTSIDCVFIDSNTFRDNCTDAIGFTWSPDVLALKQLAPLMKMELAQTTNVLPFMLLLYLVPILFVPTKCVLIRNIGMLAEE